MFSTELFKTENLIINIQKNNIITVIILLKSWEDTKWDSSKSC